MKIAIVKKRDYPELKRLSKEVKVVKSGADICLAVGGDGTFIRAASKYSIPILPIRSVERGSIGYYADLSIDDLSYVVKKLKKREYKVERLANKIEIRYKGERYYAINEAALSNVLEEVSFRVNEIVDGKKYPIYPYVMSGDGMLVTSVVGSTAYNKSAGGPIILSPEVFCITFINVDGPYRNPIVVDSKKRLEIEIVKYNGKLLYDGKEIGTLKPGNKFYVSLSKEVVNIVRIIGKKESFGDKLERIIKSRMER